MESRKNLIFDVGGVVIFIKQIDFARLDKKFNLRAGMLKSIIRICSKQVVVNRNFSERHFFEKRFSHLLNWQDYHQVLLKWFATEKLNRWLIRWIERNRENYRIILLTNNTARLKWRLEKKFKVAHHFDHVFNSANLGVRKPDPKIFKHLLKRAGAKARDCLFVDDKIENIKTARKLGFKTIWFKNNQQFLTQFKKLEF